MLVIGLTGGIASGKSSVANIFRELGIDVVDTDKISRELVLPGSVALNTIQQHFGAQVLLENGELNRRWLRQHIFTHADDKKWLENLLHPIIHRQVEDRLALCVSAYCVVIIPLLVETMQDYRYTMLDRICVVDCPEHFQMARLTARDHLTPHQAANSLTQQANRKDRLKIANDIITNDNDEVHLREQVITLHGYYLDIAKDYP